MVGPAPIRFGAFRLTQVELAFPFEVAQALPEPCGHELCAQEIRSEGPSDAPQGALPGCAAPLRCRDVATG